MKIAVIGTGYVGLVSGVCLALSGNTVVCVGRDKTKTEKINKGTVPFYEPGLDKLLNKALKKKVFSASVDFEKHVRWADIIIIAVGTPTIKNTIDLSSIETVSKQIGTAMNGSKKYHVVVVKSTVLPGVTENTVGSLVKKYSAKKESEFGLCMNPEFLREGSAVEDGMKLDRIVIGCCDVMSGKILAKAYKKSRAPILFVPIKTAEMTKYAANILFATLISYSNEISRICESIKDVDVIDVWKGVHLDKRLGSHSREVPGIVSYIYSGCGYGGSCFPKDTKALASFAKGLNLETGILDNVIKVNDTQPQRIISLLKKNLKTLNGKTVGILGLSFKPDTDDIRESPSIALIRLLQEHKAQIKAHDVKAYLNTTPEELKGIFLAKKIEEVLHDADAVVLMTSWQEYLALKPAFFKKHMKKPFIVDGRRVLSKQLFSKAGILYLGIGSS